MASRLLSRVRELERLNVKDAWLILNCDKFPTDAQIDEMETERARGRFCLLFCQRADTLWAYDSQPKPWLH